MAKRESLYKFAVDAAAGTLTLSWGPADAQQKLALSIHAPEVAANVQMAALHGFKQKIADKGALTAGDSGKVDQAARCDAVVNEFIRLREGGAWNAGGGERGPTMDQRVLVEAICMAKPDAAREEVEAKVKTMDVKTRTALLGSDQLAVYVEEVRAKMTAGVDVDGALEAFGL